MFQVSGQKQDRISRWVVFGDSSNSKVNYLDGVFVTTRTVSTRGTLLQCLASPEALYVAADSREDDGETHTDTAFKIFPCGNTGLCGISGTTRMVFEIRNAQTGELVSSEVCDIAKLTAAVVASVSSTRDPRAQIAKGVWDALTPFWRRNFTSQRRPAPLLRGKFDPAKVFTILYSNRINARVIISTIDVHDREVQNGDGSFTSTLLTPDIPDAAEFEGIIRTPTLVYAQGQPECSPDGGLLPGFKTDDDAKRIVDAIYKRAMEIPNCSASIGGPIDIAKIDDQGRHWVRRKPVQ